MATLNAKKRKAIPTGEFADPSERKYPIHDKAHADNAAARLEQEKGSMSSDKYTEIKSHITAAQKRFGETKKTKRQIHIRADIAPGGSLHVRHMFGGNETTVIGACPSIALSSAGLAVEGPVWNQVAKCGAWRGHPQGPFVIDKRSLSEIVRNFKATQNRDVPVDINHVSEQPPTAGTLPLADRGAKAHIVDLEIRGDELWGLFDYSDDARSRVQKKEFQWFSPAIRFNSKDPVSNQPIGAVLSSGALCTKPFLDGMVPLAASEAAGLASIEQQGSLNLGGPLAHAPHEYMPQVKRALKLHELATPAECSDHLGKLRAAFEMCDGNVGMTDDGIDLASYMHPLRDIARAKPGDTWDDVFDAIESLIDAASGENEDPNLNDGAPATALTEQHEEPIMAMTAEEKAQLEKAQGDVSKLTMQLTAAETEKATEKTRADAAETELRTMRDTAASAEIDGVIARHGKDKGYKPEHKAHLLSWMQKDPDGFRTMHPAPDPKATLLTEHPLVPPERRDDPKTVLCVMAGENQSQTANRLMLPKQRGGAGMAYLDAHAAATALHTRH